MRHGLLASDEELQALRERINRRPFDRFYERLQRRCALIFESAPMTEMNWQAAWASGCWNAALTAARAVQGRIFDLVIASAIDRNEAYRRRAIDELMTLVGWSTWSDPSRPNDPVDLCTAEAGVAVAVGLDWLSESLNDTQSQVALKALQDRVIEPYLRAVDDGAWWYSSVNHWNAVVNAAVGLVALATSDESESSQRACQVSRSGLQHFFDDLGREGGWDEGIGYWGYSVRYILLLAHAMARLDDDQSLLHHRGMAETGLFPIYFTPNGKTASFGDAIQPPLHGALYLLDRYFDRPEITWWLDEYSFAHDVNTTDWSKAGLALLFRNDNDAGNAPAELEPLKVFHQIGWAAMADRWPRPRFYAAVKAGDLAASSSQRDMNSLQLQVEGEMLLVDAGHPADVGSAYFSDARGEYYEVQACAHNTITVGGADHCPDAIGSIQTDRSGESCRWVLADAGSALGAGIRHHRHVILLDGELGPKNQGLIVLDELELASPEQIDLFWHAGGEIQLCAASGTGRIVGSRSELNFTLICETACEISAAQRPLEHGQQDRFLHLSAGMVGKNYLLSVFTREPLASRPSLERSNGDVVVRLADHTLRFVSQDGHLVPHPEPKA